MAGFVRFKYISRFPDPRTLPATVWGADIAGGKTKGSSYHLSPRWQTAVRQMNTQHAINYLFKQGSGWVNAMASDGTPIIEKVAFSGNVAKMLDYQDGSVLVDTLQPNSVVPELGEERSLYVHRFTAIDALGRPRQPGDGFDAYVFLLSNGPMWVKATFVEVFENRPFPIMPGSSTPPVGSYAAIVLKGTIVRQSPSIDANKIRVLAMAETVHVISEQNGWAAIGVQRWVPLSCVRRV